MKIRNKTRKYVICDAKLCMTYFSKIRGLMFRKPQDMFFWFRKDVQTPIHMWYVFYPIDLIFIDFNKKVVDVKKRIKPFRAYKPKCKYRYLIELAPCRKKTPKIGDKLEF